eukprot:gnl/MRDRNA2_/MRDRNA2_61911_c0_seq1.p1 gnl/MRDRNA2_/MRDRNA2_61911_c0~~gnl/MRDRNA2_/MRDRNA2_61911_c0_seq1.p1  ORF type:complete len:121 (+),score=24.28 gnl/MRDRNA2_/MRDRNA2_61911_c0_seq1:156-518(+)
MDLGSLPIPAGPIACRLQSRNLAGDSAWSSTAPDHMNPTAEKETRSDHGEVAQECTCEDDDAQVDDANHYEARNRAFKDAEDFGVDSKILSEARTPPRRARSLRMQKMFKRGGGCNCGDC